MDSRRMISTQLRALERLTKPGPVNLDDGYLRGTMKQQPVKIRYRPFKIFVPSSLSEY